MEDSIHPSFGRFASADFYFINNKLTVKTGSLAVFVELDKV